MSSEPNDNIDIIFNRRGTIKGSKTEVYSVLMKPKEYAGFEVLENKTLTKVDGSTLILDNIKYNIKEASDSIYLSQKEKSSPIVNLNGPEEARRGKCYLEELVGKKITAVQKHFMSIQDRIDNLPEKVTLVAFPNPFSYKVSGDDGMIFVEKQPSNSYLIGRVGQIVEDTNNIGPEEIEELKTAQKCLPFDIFDKEKLKKSNPEIFDQLYKP